MNDKWFVFALSCPPYDFKEAFGSPPMLFKTFSNSKKKVGYLSQREFWQNYVSGGFYFTLLLPSGDVQYGLIGHLKKDLSKRHLDIRFKNFIPRKLWPHTSIQKGGDMLLDGSPFPIPLSQIPFLLNCYGAYRGKPEKAIKESFG